MKACFMTGHRNDVIGYFYGGGCRERFEAEIEVMPGIYSWEDLDSYWEAFA